MRAKLATFTGLEILVLTVVIVSAAVPNVAFTFGGGDHAASPWSAWLAMVVGYFIVLGLIGIGAAIGVVSGMRARVHQRLTVAFVVLSFVGFFGISPITVLFLAIGLFNLAPISLELWPARWGQWAKSLRPSSNA